MARALRPGPATVAGLRWLAAVGPTTDAAWAAAMGWGQSATYRHAARLIQVGWAARQAMTRGDGTLLYATREGVAVAGVNAPPLVSAPAPATWAHCAACGWVAAWLTSRGRHMIGPRELLAGQEWHGNLRWTERGIARGRGHRPDLVAAVSDGGPLIPIEVELSAKSLARLRAVLTLHAKWVATEKAQGLMYACGTEYLADRVREEARPLGLTSERRTLRIELLDNLTRQATTGSEGASERRAA